MLGFVLAVLMTASDDFEHRSKTFFEIGVWPAVQLFDENTDVYGLRLSLGLLFSHSVTGLDVGLVGSAQNITGVQLNLVNLAFALWSRTVVTGLQAGLLNATRVLRGMQVGLYNETGSGFGVQVGIVNTAEDFDGVQIGLLNFNTRSALPFFPFVNARF